MSFRCSFLNYKVCQLPLKYWCLIRKCLTSIWHTYLRARSHGSPSLKSQVTWGESLQSQLLRAWMLGLTTSHEVSSPKTQVTWGQSMQFQLLRAWKLGLTTSHGVPSPKSQVPWGQSIHSQMLRACKLGLTTSHGSQVPSPKSHEVNPFILNC
jgi:hypothetical protein